MDDLTAYYLKINSDIAEGIKYLYSLRSTIMTLLIEQKKLLYTAVCQVVLTKTGEDTLTFGTDDILDAQGAEQPDQQTAQIIVTDPDKALVGVNLAGYQATITLGITTSEGTFTWDRPPMWLIGPQQYSSPRNNVLTVALPLAGLPNLLGEDHASEDYNPDTDSTDTVKTLINAVMGATLDCYSHCVAITIVYDSEDSLIDSFQPKDSFSIVTGETRLSILNRLMIWTACSYRFENDGKLHIFVPTTSGTNYDYEYSLDAGEHHFFDKSVRERIVVPGKVVVSSLPTSEDSYTGYAEDTDWDSYPEELQKIEYVNLRVASNAQCTALATAILAHHRWNADSGHGYAPMNCKAQVHDYVKVTDSSAGDSRVGNVGYLKWHYRGNSNTFDFEFRFGSIYPGGLLGTLPPSLSGGGTIDLSALWEQINMLRNNLELLGQDVYQIYLWTKAREKLIYYNHLYDVMIAPHWDSENSKYRSVVALGGLKVYPLHTFGPWNQPDQNSAIYWDTEGGTRDHAFEPDITEHGTLGTVGLKWLEGHFSKMHVYDELYIPEEA